MAEIIQRRDIKYWTTEEKDEFLEALYLMKNTTSKYNSNWTSYDYYSYVHNQSFNYFNSWAHNNWGFLPWHRWFIYYFERELQYFTKNSSFRLPFWNASDKLSTYYVLEDTSFIGGNGNPIDPKSNISCDKWYIPYNLRYYTANISEYLHRPNNHSCLIRNIDSEHVPLPSARDWHKLINMGLPYDIYPYTIPPKLFVTKKSFRVDLEGYF